MNQWVIPYTDQEPDFWAEIEQRFGAYIQEVYVPMPIEVVASGRGRQPDRFVDAFLRDTRLPKAVLANPIVLARPIDQAAPIVVETLRRLHGDWGVSTVIVTNLGLAQWIKERLPQFKVTASTLMGVSTPLHVLMVRDWVDAITPDTRLLRDLQGLQRLRQAFAGEIRLLVNEACLPGCPYRAQHFYEMAYSDGYPQSLCREVLDRHPWLRLTGAWVLPQHLHYYDGLFDSLKLAGRVTLRDRARYMAVLEAYVHRRPLSPPDIGGGPASVIQDIEISDEWFRTVLHCDKSCHACSICRDYAQGR